MHIKVWGVTLLLINTPLYHLFFFFNLIKLLMLLMQFTRKKIVTPSLTHTKSSKKNYVLSLTHNPINNKTPHISLFLFLASIFLFILNINLRSFSHLIELIKKKKAFASSLSS